MEISKKALAKAKAKEAAAMGLPWVELSTDADNIPSQRVILNNGGYLLGRFRKPAVYGGAESLRYRIDLNGPAVPDAGV
jgi:predicted acetyltransferase